MSTLTLANASLEGGSFGKTYANCAEFFGVHKINQLMVVHVFHGLTYLSIIICIYCNGELEKTPPLGFFILMIYLFL